MLRKKMKIKRQLARLKSLISNKKKRIQVSPEFTNHCNFKCKFCPHSYFKKEKTKLGNKFNREKGFMDPKLFDLVLENANEYAREVSIGFFGEQMLHPNFRDFIKLFPKKRSYKVNLNTNWSLATAEIMEDLRNLDEVRISIDASNAKLWNYLCPGGPILDLKGNPSHKRYETFIEKIKYWFSLPHHPRTKLVYVVSSKNKQDKKKFLEKFLPLIPSRDHIVTKTVLTYGGVMYDSHMSKYPCKIINEGRIVVGWNGNCSPCNLDVNLKLNIGNLYKYKDMEKMINSKKYTKVMENIKRKKGICRNCFDANNRSEDNFYYGKSKGVLK